jgi:2-dehydropantoate 2-reductase
MPLSDDTTTMTKTKIIIAGIGGVGGYFGGLLANHFYDNENVEISFVARGEHLKEIQKNGLKVIKGENEFIAKPHIATDNIAEIGIVDFIIIATKSYDLETIIQQLRPCVNQDTIVLPLLNGVDSKERIKKILPDNIVLDGCVYIVSRLKQYGVIENSGNIQTLYFGLDNIVNEKLLLLENLFKEANIEASLSRNISTIIWEKFIFISPTATATTYFDKSIGEVLSDKEHYATITELIEEVKQIAKAKQIVISEDITEKTLKKLQSLPLVTTSSMHSDFKNKKSNNELQSLTGYVLREGVKYNLETPIYNRTYAALEKKSGI